MSEYLTALALAMLPAAGNFAGGLLAEMFRVSARVLSIALHAAAGIVLAVVAVELMPQAMEATHAWVVVLAFFGGGLFFVAVDSVLDIVGSRIGGAVGGAGPWAIYFGVSIDLFSDGLMIGTGSTISFGLALLVALGQVAADIPEGFATIANFRNTRLSRPTRLVLSAAFAIPLLLGTTVGYWAVQGQPEDLKLALLAFTAGILTTVAVEEMIPSAHEGGEQRLATIAFVGGFALFALLSAYLE